MAAGCAPAARRQPHRSQAETDLDVARALWLTNGFVGLRFDDQGFGIGPVFSTDEWALEGTDRLRPLPNTVQARVFVEGRPLTWPLTLSVNLPHKSAVSWPRREQHGVVASRTVELTEGRPEVVETIVVTTARAVSLTVRPGPTGVRCKATDSAGRTTPVDEPSSFQGGVTVECRSSFGDPRPSRAERPALPAIRIEGPAQDQAAVNAMLEALARSHDPGLDVPPGPFGLSNAKYGGRVFWDSDAWMFPALMFLAPERAAVVTEFRTSRLPAARLEYQEWAARAGKPVVPGAAKYPWEAGPDGRENAPAESERQHHVSATVAFWARQAALAGVVPAPQVRRLVEEVGKFLLQRAERRPDGKWTFRGVMSPDEFATVDDDLYTNLVAERVLGPKWQGRFYRPRDATTFLTYTGDRLRGYKQAAALLAVWPLQEPQAEDEALAMLDRFAGKTVPNGPAMSLSIEALVRARFDDPERAYEVWLESWRRYTHGPHLQFSESPSGRNTYFLTGAGGCVNALLYGFVGLRLDSRPAPGAPWSRQLASGAWVSLKPRLPKAWRSVTVEPFVFDGQRHVLTVRTGAVKIQPQPPGNRHAK
jgi:hypothetical protein